MCVERKGTGKRIALKGPRRLKKARQCSRITAILVIRIDTMMLIVGTKKKMQVNDKQNGKTKEMAEEPE